MTRRIARAMIGIAGIGGLMAQPVAAIAGTRPSEAQAGIAAVVPQLIEVRASARRHDEAHLVGLLLPLVVGLAVATAVAVAVATKSNG